MSWFLRDVNELGAQRHLEAQVATGRALWKVHIDKHPGARITGSPTLVGTTLFVPVTSVEEVTANDPKYSCCSFIGSIVALRASTGDQLWKTYTISEKPTTRAMSSAGVQLMGPSGAAVWSSPTYDAEKGMIYVTTGDNYPSPRDCNPLSGAAPGLGGIGPLSPLSMISISLSLPLKRPSRASKPL